MAPAEGIQYLAGFLHEFLGGSLEEDRYDGLEERVGEEDLDDVDDLLDTVERLIQANKVRDEEDETEAESNEDKAETKEDNNKTETSEDKKVKTKED